MRYANFNLRLDLRFSVVWRNRDLTEKLSFNAKFKFGYLSLSLSKFQTIIINMDLRQRCYLIIELEQNYDMSRIWNRMYRTQNVRPEYSLLLITPYRVQEHRGNGACVINNYEINIICYNHTVTNFPIFIEGERED